MAVIGKIQRNSLLLLIVIGGAMLAFIFTEAVRNMGGEDTERLPLATVWGEPIDEEEYYDLVDQFKMRDEQQASQQNKPYEDKQQKQSEDNAFNESVRRVLMDTEFEKLGISCSTEELNDMIHGNHIHPWVRQIFQNPQTGQFERDSVRAFINNLEIEPPNEEQRANWLEARAQWKTFEDELKDNRKAEKYVTLVKKGMFVNTIEAKDYYKSKNTKKKISFVVQRFTELNPQDFQPTEEDIRAYYEEHKNEPKYEMEESRDLEYISFPIKPTKADKENIAYSLEEIREQFAKTDNNIAFIRQHTENEFYSDSAKFRAGRDGFLFDSFRGNSQYPESIDDQIQEAEVGDVIGPVEYVDKQQDGQEFLAIAKVVDLEKEMQSWVRHILIKSDANRTEEEAKQRADSVMQVIREKDNFPEMVQEVSEDPGSLEYNGEYKWFPEGRMVPEFNDAAFNGDIGKLQLVKTTYGYHIVEVLGRGERVLPTLAVIVKKVEPSEASVKDMENEVFDFIFSIQQSGEDSAFHRAAEDSSLTIQETRVWMNQDFIMGLDNPKEMLRFAFSQSAEEGDISDPVFDGDKFVVAYLSNKIEEGVPEFEDVKKMMRTPALRKKQADMYKKKMSGKSSLSEVAKVTTNGEILDAEVNFGSNTITGAGGNEPEVIGHIFTNIPEGSMTKPIVGESGVYVIVVNSVTPAPETTDYFEQRENMEIARSGAADAGVMKALRKKADVVDNRRKKELQGR